MSATMISLIGSLADNKSALGRRYGEWAVSAPTIESAVAAAAMAQDELGHARSTYPVLAELGVDRSHYGGLDAGSPLSVISRELPDWASVIAANLVVDGVLTTFVASARDSTIEPLAQRARRITRRRERTRSMRRPGPGGSFVPTDPISICCGSACPRCGPRPRGGPDRSPTLGMPRRSPRAWSRSDPASCEVRCEIGSAR